ncbi:FH2 domain-containing protein 1-like [Ornithorhynchus anatinus]|uniref:FH2 domain-containing protein 1-like n=1 Tax=Ornithorhynchus anatinus TaxID=9258 RepID=UPI0010A90FF7|nr:FH2 domain-containing protein 1-like [Ornithorhynchus anatinus]
MEGPRLRLRSLHWAPLPAERVRGRRSVWGGGGPGPQPDPGPLDLQRLEELFGERPGPPARGIPRQVCLLDPKKVLTLGIVLRQCKRPAVELVEAVRAGTGGPYGAQRLRQLCRVLPDSHEVQRLRSFQAGEQGRRSRSRQQLSEAELFMLLLVQVPCYPERLALMVLKEEFLPQLGTLRANIAILTQAAQELLACEDLHCIIRLILKAGNHLNAGGYAGGAVGFRMASLLRLTDTKANTPGIHLLHFVAMEAGRREPRLLHFPLQLPHVGPASRIPEQEVEEELELLSQRLRGARTHPPPPEVWAQMEPFLQEAERELQGARACLQGLAQLTETLMEFFCEDGARCPLQELCATFHTFALHFQTAAQENAAREWRQWQRRQQGDRRQRRRGGQAAPHLGRSCSLPTLEQELERELGYPGRGPRGRGAPTLPEAWGGNLGHCPHWSLMPGPPSGSPFSPPGPSPDVSPGPPGSSPSHLFFSPDPRPPDSAPAKAPLKVP